MTLSEDLALEVSRSVGLRVEEGWATSIQAALAACAPERLGVEVLRDPHLRARVVAEIARRVTVPESYFFRNHAQLAWVCDHAGSVARSEARRARLWCAGSAGGEEPYSLAMMLHRSHGAALVGTFDIEASDLNPDAIAKARDAVYTPWSFRGAPPWCLAYFTEASPTTRRLAHPEVLGAVRFEVESCQSGADRQADGSLDVVVFRNVAIYLEDAAIRAMHARFARVLRPGGLLALGPSDPPPPGPTFELLGYRDHAPVFVRRPDDAPAAVPSGPAAPPVSPRGIGRPPSISSSDHRAAAPDPPIELPASPARRPRMEPAAPGATSAREADAAAHRERGHVHLQRGEPAAAVAALRSAVYLDPTDPLTRYFYAIALWESGDQRQAVRQLANVTATLGERAPAEVLGDDATPVADLLRSATFLGRQWR